MSKTSSLHAIAQSYPRRVGVVPRWVETYDEVVEWDAQRQVAVCRGCKGEVKNLGWVRTHMADCFGVKS